MKVLLLAARNLTAADSDGTSDPYAVVFVGEDESTGQKTKVCSSNLNPVWDETLSFAGVLARDTLTVRVYDSDTFGSDDLIGEMKASFAQMTSAGGASKWYKLEGDEAGGVGEVAVADNENGGTLVGEAEVEEMGIELEVIECGSTEQRAEWAARRACWSCPLVRTWRPILTAVPVTSMPCDDPLPLCLQRTLRCATMKGESMEMLLDAPGRQTSRGSKHSRAAKRQVVHL